jgi:hypothetical protein
MFLLLIAAHPQLGLPIVIGHLNVCLCVSALPVFIHANAVAQLAALIMGEDAAIALITALVCIHRSRSTTHHSYVQTSYRSTARRDTNPAPTLHTPKPCARRKLPAVSNAPTATCPRQPTIPRLAPVSHPAQYATADAITSRTAAAPPPHCITGTPTGGVSPDTKCAVCPAGDSPTGNASTPRGTSNLVRLFFHCLS